MRIKTRNLISKSSIKIKASASRIWEILVTPEIAKSYFFGAEIETDWKVGSPITFTGEYNGNKYQEKGTLLIVAPNTQLQYSHWSNFDGLPDEPENYRTWTFDLEEMNGMSQLSISEDNIPTEKQKNRSDEFWAEVLLKIKHLAEA
ncbi:MAG: ATPase [Thalassobius sp.]|nr:ATPase [Thalassovita sp.]